MITVDHDTFKPVTFARVHTFAKIAYIPTTFGMGKFMFWLIYQISSGNDMGSIQPYAIVQIDYNFSEKQNDHVA